MTQMLQMNSMVQLEVGLMAEDFSKAGVPALTKVEFVESIDVFPGKCTTCFQMLGHGICSGGRVDHCRVPHDMEQGDPALCNFSVPVCPMKTEVCSPSKKERRFFFF